MADVGSIIRVLLSLPPADPKPTAKIGSGLYAKQLAHAKHMRKLNRRKLENRQDPQDIINRWASLPFGRDPATGQPNSAIPKVIGAASVAASNLSHGQFGAAASEIAAAAGPEAEAVVATGKGIWEIAKTAKKMSAFLAGYAKSLGDPVTKAAAEGVNEVVGGAVTWIEGKGAAIGGFVEGAKDYAEASAMLAEGKDFSATALMDYASKTRDIAENQSKLESAKENIRNAMLGGAVGNALGQAMENAFSGGSGR